jgi:hypothetical protein
VLDLRECLVLAEFCARGEHPAGAGDDNRADVVVGLDWKDEDSISNPAVSVPVPSRRTPSR